MKFLLHSSFILPSFLQLLLQKLLVRNTSLCQQQLVLGILQLLLQLGHLGLKWTQIKLSECTGQCLSQIPQWLRHSKERFPCFDSKSIKSKSFALATRFWTKPYVMNSQQSFFNPI